LNELARALIKFDFGRSSMFAYYDSSYYLSLYEEGVNVTEILKNQNYKSKLEVHVILTRLITLKNFVTELEFSALMSRWEEMANLIEPEHQMTMQLFLIIYDDPHKNDRMTKEQAY
jgi:hypothetical protein